MRIRHNENCILNYPTKEEKLVSQNLETKFYLEEEKLIGEDKLYTAFELIYKLADRGIISLDHEDIERKGVKVVL